MSWRYHLKELWYGFKRVPHKIWNLARWFNIIWGDVDWDDSAILKIMRFKLQNQSDYIGTSGIKLESDRDVKWMQICIRLIDRLVDDTYESEYYKYQDIKMTSKPSDVEGMFELEMETVFENYSVYLKMYPNDVRRYYKSKWYNISERDDKYWTCIMVAKMRHNRAKQLLFNILNEKLEQWWD